MEYEQLIRLIGIREKGEGMGLTQEELAIFFRCVIHEI